MVNYSLGKVYKITSENSDKCYIGSTCKRHLKERLKGHLIRWKDYESGLTKRKISSFEILSMGNYQIVLLEEFSCNSKEELWMRERHWVEHHRGEGTCVNKKLPILTEEEREAYFKEYYSKNKEVLLSNYRKYYEKNRDKIAEKKAEVIPCLCGGTYTRSHKARHMKSNKHLVNTM